VRFYPGEANFLLVEPKGGAPQAVSYLKEQGILVRPMRPPLEQCFRMSLRKMDDMRHFFKVFGDYFSSTCAG
jgi:histidinol-phosphate/aromatic aminotransferase/cobyric acid decarboxylase-like protein